MEKFSTDDLGSVVVVLDFPEEWNFGIDMTMWKIGDRFKGVRGIPKGVHFVYWASPNEEWRQGNFHFFDRDEEFVVYKWDSEHETLKRFRGIEENEHAMLNLINDVSILSSLAPFNQVVDDNQVSEWKNLSQYISNEVIDRIQPVSHQAFGSSQDQSTQPAEGPTIFWSPIPDLEISRDSSPSSRSRLHMDTSTRLRRLIDSMAYQSVMGILGEIQSAFVLFLLGQNYEAFIQWRRLTELFLRSGQLAIQNSPELYEAFKKVLIGHVRLIPIELLNEEDLSDPLFESSRGGKQIFLLPLIVDFIEECDGLDVTELVSEISLKFNGSDGWMSNAIYSEDGPAIVEL